MMTTLDFIEYQKQNVRLLKEIIPTIRYKTNWAFCVVSRDEPFSRHIFRIVVRAPDSRALREPEQYSRIPFVSKDPSLDGRMQVKLQKEDIWLHDFRIDPYPIDQEGLERWIFEKIALVEVHEAMEAFLVNGVAVFYPDHINSPYEVVRITEQRT